MCDEHWIFHSEFDEHVAQAGVARRTRHKAMRTEMVQAGGKAEAYHLGLREPAMAKAQPDQNVAPVRPRHDQQQAPTGAKPVRQLPERCQGI